MKFEDFFVLKIVSENRTFDTVFMCPKFKLILNRTILVFGSLKYLSSKNNLYCK